MKVITIKHLNKRKEHIMHDDSFEKLMVIIIIVVIAIVYA